MSPGDIIFGIAVIIVMVAVALAFYEANQRDQEFQREAAEFCESKGLDLGNKPNNPTTRIRENNVQCIDSTGLVHAYTFGGIPR